MEEQIVTAQPEKTTVEVVDIQFRPGQKIYFFSPDGEVYQPGDHVIIDTAPGQRTGRKGPRGKSGQGKTGL